MGNENTVDTEIVLVFKKENIILILGFLNILLFPVFKDICANATGVRPPPPIIVKRI